MVLDKYIDLAFALAIGVSIGFPMFGVLTTHRFKHRLDQILRLRTVAFWCIAWMTFVGLIGTSFGWLDGLIRYSGETLLVGKLGFLTANLLKSLYFSEKIMVFGQIPTN